MSRPTPGDPWGIEQHLEHWSKRKPTVEPLWATQKTKKLRPQPTKMNSFMFGAIIKSDARPTRVQLKMEAKLLTVIGLNTKHADCRIIFMLYPIPNKLRNGNPIRGRTGNVTVQKWKIYYIKIKVIVLIINFR